MPEPWEEYTATQEVSPWEEFGQTAVAEPPEPSDLARRFKEEQAIGEAAESKANRLASAESALKLIAPSAENPLGPIGGVFRSAQATGKMLGAVVTDIADLPSEIASNQLLRNLRAWWNQKPEPIPGRLGLTGQVAKGIAETAPVVAEQMMLTAAGIPAPVSGGIAFGGAAEAAGAPPAEIAKQTAFGVVLGPAQQWSKEATGKVLKETIARLPVPIPETALKAAEFTGSQTAVNALFAGMEAPDYVEAYKRNPKEAKDMLVQQVAMNLAFGVHDALGIRNPNVRSETIKAVYGDLRKMLDDLEVQKPISEKTPEQTQKDIEQAAKTLTERTPDAIQRESTQVLRPVQPQSVEGEGKVPVSGAVETAAVRGEPVEAKAGEVTPTEGRAVLGDVAVDPATGKIPASESQNFISRLGDILEDPKSDLSSERAFLLGDKFPVEKLDELRQYANQVEFYVSAKLSERYKKPTFQERNRLARLRMFVNEVIQGSEKPTDRPIIQETIARAKEKEKVPETKPDAVPEPKPAEAGTTTDLLRRAQERAAQVAASGVPRLSPEVVKAVQALPPLKEGYVRWWHGRKGVGGGGLGDAYSAKGLPEDPLAGVRKALQYGPELSYTDVPRDVSDRFEAGRRRGEATITDKEWASKSKEVGTFEQPISAEIPAAELEPAPIEPAKPTPEVPKPEPAKAAEPMRVGPGAMTAGEIESRARVQGDRAAAGEKPPGNNPPVTTDGGLTPNIEVSRANRDMNILNNLNTAQWTFWMGRLGQPAKSAIERIFLGEFRMRESINRDVQTYIDATISSLPRQFRKKGGQEFFNLLNGQTLESITKKWQGKPGGNAIIAGAEKVKGRLEEIRTTIRDTKRDSFTGYLNSADKAFVEDLFKKNIDPNVDTSTMTKAQMSDALALNEFPDDWGIADGTYLPHLFFGNYKITVRMPGAEGAEFVTRAKTIGEAKARIYELTKNNPEYSKAKFIVEQDSVVPADMIRLGDKQFWNMVSRMKKSLEMTTAEIRQAQQGIIGKRSSKQKWFGSTMQRLGFGGYETNFRRVMTAYLNGFHRWKELSSMQRDVQPMIDQVKKEGRFQAAEGLNDIMEALWGKPARSTLQFDNFVRNIPGARDWIKPLALDRWSRNARTIISNLTLRTLRFATINRLQPLQGLYPLVGEKILLQGKKLQHTPEGRTLLDEAGIRLDPGQYSEAGRMTKFGALMQRFSGEQSNQEWAFLSMYLHGTQQGMGKAQAIEYAKLRGQLMTQFTPLVSDIPPALRGPGGQLLFQFKRFPIKQLELVGSMIKDKNAPGLARMLGIFAIMGGASFFARQFFLDKEKQLRFRQMVDKQVGKGAGDMVMYGLPGYVGADISGSLVLGDEPFGANIYEKAGRALAGPTLSIGVETARRIATAARKPVSTLDKAEAVMRSIPTLKPIAELIRLESGNVDVLSPDGETKYRRQISDAIVGLGAFRSANEANKQLAVNAIIELKKETARLKNAYFVSKGGEVEKKTIKDFNARWPEIAILPSELSRYVTYRRGEFGKTEEQKVAGKKYRRILAR